MLLLRKRPTLSLGPVNAVVTIIRNLIEAETDVGHWCLC